MSEEEQIVAIGRAIKAADDIGKNYMLLRRKFMRPRNASSLYRMRCEKSR